MTNRCPFWDCGWCYAPDAFPNNSKEGQCLNPDGCVFLSSYKSMRSQEKNND